MHHLPINLYDNKTIRQLERLSIERFSFTEALLMERAGKAAFAILQQYWSEAKKIVVLCGAGNNGGDGYVIASLAHFAGLEVTVYHLGDIHALKEPAKKMALEVFAAGINIIPYKETVDLSADLIVDALLGIGLERDVQGDLAKLIHRINEQDTPVLSIDTPTGLNTNTGSVHGCAIRADATITFLGLKPGLFTGEGPSHVGHVFFHDLGLPENAYDSLEVFAQRITLNSFKKCLGPRSRSAHKGDFGHLLIIGGNYGMAGAVTMAAEAALRVGAGLVTVATRNEHVNIVTTRCPEVMCYGVKNLEDLKLLLEKATCILIGPGLGQEDWSKMLFDAAVSTKKPKILDADALNLLAQKPQICHDWILTPHPGEAARLLQCTNSEIQQDRFKHLQALKKKYGGVPILKGAGSLTMNEEGTSLYLCSEGNPGMATAGMGDVLSGVLAGLLTQGFPLECVAPLGICLHANAGDEAAKNGERGLRATDLIPYLRTLVNIRRFL